MPHYGILREYRFEDIEDVRGSEVYGVNDEKLGTIDDVIFDHSTGDIRYVVLNPGLLSKKVMVPANRFQPYGHHEDKFYAELDKDRLEMLPEFNDQALKSEGDWSIYEKEYESRLNDGAVLYNKDTGRIVTPPVDQVEGAHTAPLTAAERQSLDRDLTPQRMGKVDNLIGAGGSVSEKTTLRPQKASIAGKKDVVDAAEPVRTPVTLNTKEVQIGTVPLESHSNKEIKNKDLKNQDIAANKTVPPTRPVKEVTDTMGGEMEIPVEEQNARIKDNLREPGIYHVEEKSDLNAGLGRRWTSFQDRIRSRRDKIIVDCPDCGSQEKVA